MKLVYSPASPYVRKVLVCLHETGQIDDIEMAQVKTSPVATADDVAAANPLGKIPALVRPNGPAIYDSRVITRFLDARAEAGLYPEAHIWETLTLEATADGIMDAAVGMIYEVRLRPEDKVFEGWLDAQWAKVSRALDALEGRWMSHLSGRLDMGQIAVACALGYLDFRHGARDWRKGRDALADWYDEFSERPAMVATQPRD
ncbi:MAG: glutathione S-transferase [Sediminimonas qiaohouensis]|uniref:Glutathione S-transferase n=1 Tax=Sediminimonas qiaohouensis TaxID=552061 RepID=A0A7C9L8C7_9RHOB|nr:glutathione S-transferase [Sediminimonas qiaohouensis]MTJ04554.1 glutathione S-transferase [Sediminimonas qiaohouensis]